MAGAGWATAASRPVYASGVPDSRLRPTQLAPTRLARSPWLRAGLLAVAVGLAVYGLASQWTQVHAALAKLDGYDVAAAALAVIAGLGGMLMAWRALLADLGSPLPLPAAIASSPPRSHGLCASRVGASRLGRRRLRRLSGTPLAYPGRPAAAAQATPARMAGSRSNMAMLPLVIRAAGWQA